MKLEFDPNHPLISSYFTEVADMITPNWEFFICDLTWISYHKRPVGFPTEKEKGKYAIGEPVQLSSKPFPVCGGWALRQVPYNVVTSTNTLVRYRRSNQDATPNTDSFSQQNLAYSPKSGRRGCEAAVGRDPMGMK